MTLVGEPNISSKKQLFFLFIISLFCALGPSEVTVSEVKELNSGL